MSEYGVRYALACRSRVQILVFLRNDKLKHIGHCAPSFILETMETMITHLTREQLEAGLDHIRQSPSDEGLLQLIVRRPSVESTVRPDNVQ